MCPDVGLQRRRAVAPHQLAEAIGQFETDRSWSLVQGSVQLEAAFSTRSFGDHRGVVTRELAGLDPGAESHAAGEVQSGRVSKVDVIVCSVELDGLTVLARSPRGSIDECSVVSVT